MMLPGHSGVLKKGKENICAALSTKHTDVLALVSLCVKKGS